jgi:hypothetical protein
VHVVGADDLVLGFLNRNEFSELGRLDDLTFTNRFRVRFEQAQNFVGNVRVATQYTLSRLVDDPFNQRDGVSQRLCHLVERRSSALAKRTPALCRSTQTSFGVSNYRTGRPY